MPTADPLELVLRGAAAGIFLHLALAGWLAGRSAPRSGRIAVTALNAGLFSYLLVSSPTIRDASPFFAILTAISALNPVLLAWTALILFEDDFRPQPVHWIAAAAIAATAWLSPVWPVLSSLRNVAVAALYLWLLWTVLRGLRSDLIDSRRRLRIALFAASAILGLGVTLVESGLAPPLAEIAVLRLQATVFLAIGLAFALWQVSTGGDVWFQATPTPADTAASMSPADEAVRARIVALMANGAWREEGLTVSRMAQLARTQEHRVRRIVNRGMGYRNFNAYLNAARIAEARRILQDPDMGDRRIAEIAFELGFGSLGPFNRAFREATGESPSDFRRKVLAGR